MKTDELLREARELMEDYGDKITLPYFVGGARRVIPVLCEALEAKESLNIACRIAIEQMQQKIDHYEDILGAILDAQESSGWISVDEGLPSLPDELTCTTRCLVAVNAPIPKTVAMVYERTIVRNKPVTRWKWQGRISPWDVTHWQPLPEPPKGEEKNHDVSTC